MTDLILFACVLTALALFFAGRHGLRTARSYSLRWPGNLSHRQQASICRLYFLRNGIARANLSDFNDVCDLELEEGPNLVYVCFRSTEFPPTRLYLQHQSAIQRKRHGTIIVVVVAEASDLQRVVVETTNLPLPLLYRAQLPELKRLLLKRPNNLRDNLLGLSLPYQRSHHTPDTVHAGKETSSKPVQTTS